MFFNYARNLTDEEIKAYIYYLERGLLNFFDSSWYHCDEHIRLFFKMCNLLELKIPKERDYFNIYITVYKNYQIKKQELNKKVLIKNQTKRKLRFDTENYFVFVPTVADDFLDEANQQSNCVYRTYLQSVIDGRCNIVFIRRKDNPNKSCITCEINQTGHIIQYLGKHNSRISPNQGELYNFRFEYERYLKKLFQEGV